MVMTKLLAIAMLLCIVSLSAGVWTLLRLRSSQSAARGAEMAQIVGMLTVVLFVPLDFLLRETDAAVASYGVGVVGLLIFWIGYLRKRRLQRPRP